MACLLCQLNVLYIWYFYLQEMVNALREELVTKGNSLDEVKKAVKDVSTMYISTIKCKAICQWSRVCGKTSRIIKALSKFSFVNYGVIYP